LDSQFLELLIEIKTPAIMIQGFNLSSKVKELGDSAAHLKLVYPAT